MRLYIQTSPVRMCVYKSFITTREYKIHAHKNRQTALSDRQDIRAMSWFDDKVCGGIGFVEQIHVGFRR